MELVLPDDLFGFNKERASIERIRMFEPTDGYILAYSGGKDSTVLLDLARRAGVQFEAHYSVTTVDPPELIWFIRDYEPEVVWDRPKCSMWRLIPEWGFPTIRRRWCCTTLKERAYPGKTVLLGIRSEESTKRASRRMVEQCHKNKSQTYVSPILDWKESEIWEYINGRTLPYCSLYDEGWRRVGCVCCPMGNPRRDSERWPKMAEGYRRAFHKLYEKRKTESEGRCFRSADEMFEWWLSKKPSPWQKNKEQLGMGI